MHKDRRKTVLTQFMKRKRLREKEKERVRERERAGVFSVSVKDPSCAAGEKEGRGAVKLATSTWTDKTPSALLSML